MKDHLEDKDGMEELLGDNDKEKLDPSSTEAGDSSLRLPDDFTKKKNGSTLLYFKILFFSVLIGGMALGGFWGYTKINEGMVATDAIIDINEKISKMESSQKAMHKKLDELIAEVDRVSKSGKIIAEIPKSLASLEKRIDALDQSLARLPQSSALDLEETEREEPKKVISLPETVVPNQAPPLPELDGESPSSPEERSMEKENADLGSFMKTLFRNMKRALSWTWVKLKWLYQEITNAYLK